MTQEQWAAYTAILLAEIHLDELPDVLRQVAENFRETNFPRTAEDWSLAADAVQRVVERGTE